MAARYRNNVSSKHYVHVRRKGCTGSTGVSRDGTGGRALGGGGRERKYFHILVRLKCNPHAIPHADIKGAWRRPYWPCMTFQAHWKPALSTSPTGAHSIFNGTWQNLAVCYKHSLKCTDCCCARCPSPRELRVRIFTRPTGPPLASNWPQQLCKLLSNIKNQKWWRLGTLVMAQIKHSAKKKTKQ